jgi:hypothetical protein
MVRGGIAIGPPEWALLGGFCQKSVLIERQTKGEYDTHEEG